MVAIQRIALEHLCRCGYRRVTAELKRREMPVNHKRVARIMREDNLLAAQPRMDWPHKMRHRCSRNRSGQSNLEHSRTTTFNNMAAIRSIQNS
jgi:hypothetical protein